MKTIDYYFPPVSPWTHLGRARCAQIAARHGIEDLASTLAAGKGAYEVNSQDALAQG